MGEENVFEESCGRGPVKVLVLGERRGCFKKIDELLKGKLNLTVWVYEKGRVEEVRKYLSSGRVRPFVLIVDLAVSGKRVGGDGPRWREILRRGGGENLVGEAVRIKDEFSCWYSSNYEFSSVRIGRGRSDRWKVLGGIFDYLNGR